MLVLRSIGLAAVAVMLGGSVACSDDTTSEPAKPEERVVVITMKDDSFTPTSFTAKVNETVRFRFVNVGEKRHEAVIGDQAYQDAHALMMESMTTVPVSAAPAAYGATASGGQLASHRTRMHPGMTDPNAVSVEPGETGEIVYSFAKRADLLIACHEPGHLMAGMVAPLTVR